MPGIVVLPYDPRWQRRGAELTAALLDVLAPHAVRVDHIGSTAVPGMAAKAVLDLQVSVTDLDAADAFDVPLARLGLTRRPWTQDHIPAGSGDPPARWRKRVWSSAPDTDERLHLHVRLVGSPNERLALLFRDWLRDRPAAVAAYGEFKRRLAATGLDTDAYSDVKDPVVDLVVAAAEDWAAATDWSVR